MNFEDKGMAVTAVVVLVILVAGIVAIVRHEYREQNEVNATDVENQCAVRLRNERNRERHERLFLGCVNSTRRVATHEDEEADIVEECRKSANTAYPVSEYAYGINKYELAEANKRCNF